MKISLEEIIEYLNQKNISKEDRLYILYLYNHIRNNQNNEEGIPSYEELIGSLRVLNNSLKEGADNKLVCDRVQKELDIISNISDVRNSNQDSIIKAYYELSVLMYEENLDIEKKYTVLNRILKESKNNEKSK